MDDLKTPTPPQGGSKYPDSPAPAALDMAMAEQLVKQASKGVPRDRELIWYIGWRGITFEDRIKHPRREAPSAP